MSLAQTLGGPIFDTHLELLKITPTFFRSNVPNFEILQVGDIPDMSSNSIMSFHNDLSMLVHCLSRHQQNRPHGVDLLISATPLKVLLLRFLKDMRLLPKSIAISMYSILTIKYHADCVSSTTIYRKKL